MTKGKYVKTQEHIKNATHKQTQDTRDKISKVRKLRFKELGYLNSKETRKKMSKSWDYNKHFTEDTKKKISESSKGKHKYWLGKTFSEEHKKKIGTKSLGRKHTDEAKKKISDSHKGKSYIKGKYLGKKWEERYGEEKARDMKLKLSNYSKSRTMSEATRKKMSLAGKGKKHIIINKGNMGKNPMSRNNSLFIKGHKSRLGMKSTETHKRKLEEKVWGKRRGKNFETIYGEEKAKILRTLHKKLRSTQIIPVKDTSIEIKIQNFLKELGIEFFTHQYMKIKYGYLCDIFIPVQEGIAQKTIIECDGDYWHGNPEMFDYRKLSERIRCKRVLDFERTNQLEEQGFRVIRLWEHEIKPMQLEKFKEVLVWK